MERICAIYARKSVERADSVSIESQIEFCRYETRGCGYQIYSDNGYSGKNTDRPAFNTMIKDVESGKIRSVIVYRLDRISRSILDFSSMMEIFQKHDVSFVSATEKFDTSSPMGRAMLNICIVFAQLERETIQQRVTDAYSSRSKKGFYMGGKVPYGFSVTDTVLHGIHTSKYLINPEEARDIERIFSLYSPPSASLGDVVRELSLESEHNKRGKLWSTARISELIRNPVYCRADYSIYEFYKSHGSVIYGEPEDFNGINGLYLFRGENKSRKNSDLKNKEIVIAPHEGIIDAQLWLKCRKKLMTNHQVKTGKPKNSWLCGVVKCGNCGYAAVIKKSETRAERYFICSCTGCCGIGRTVYADTLEQEIKGQIEIKISTLSVRAPVNSHNEKNREIEKIRIDIDRIDSKISALVEKVESADSVLMKHISNKVAELDSQKQELSQKLNHLEKSGSDYSADEITDCMSVWDIMSFDDKRSVVKLLIRKISLDKNGFSVEWNV